MTGHDGILTDLLEGDFVRLELADQTIHAEVVTVDRDLVEGPTSETGSRYAIQFMAVGEDALSARADRFRITVEPAAGGSRISKVLVEVYAEEALEYKFVPSGELEGVEMLESIREVRDGKSGGSVR